MTTPATGFQTMFDRTTLLLGLAVLVAATVTLWVVLSRPALTPEKLRAAYADPAPAPPAHGLRVFHLGHSLVGRDMPAMLAQLAGDTHRYESQLGWGTSLKEHYEPAETINGFEQENDHPRFRPAREAIGSGDYDAVVLTEMVEIRDAIKYHDSSKYVARWASLAREAGPAGDVFAAVVVLYGVADFDHFGQHDGVIVARADRLACGAEAGVVVFLLEAVDGFGGLVMLFQGGAPAELAFVAVRVARQLGQHGGHVAADEAVAEVEDTQAVGRRRRGRVGIGGAQLLGRQGRPRQHHPEGDGGGHENGQSEKEGRAVEHRLKPGCRRGHQKDTRRSCTAGVVCRSAEMAVMMWPWVTT